MRRLEFDNENLKVRTRKMTFARVAAKLLKYLFVSAAVAALYYLVFAFFHDSERERILKEENNYIAGELKGMQERMDLLDGVIANLKNEDRTIYRDVFNSALPNYVLEEASGRKLDFQELYNLSEAELIRAAHEQAITADGEAAQVSQSIRQASDLLALGTTNPRKVPSIVPLRSFTVGQFGASCGNKYNPFYKTLKFHSGIDILAPVGMEVLAAADGTVSEIKSNKRGVGNTITITHSNGIKTVYKHLGEIVARPGTTVRRGAVIARVGTSGRSFAPHLHYEVVRDGEYQEPVHYFFADLSPLQYREALLLALTTGQSLD